MAKILFNDKQSGHQVTASNVNEIKTVVNTNADDTVARFVANETLATQRQSTLSADLSRTILGENLGVAVPATIPVSSPKTGQYYDATAGTYINFSATGLVVPATVGNRKVTNAKLVWSGKKWGVTYILLTAGEGGGSGGASSFTDLEDAPNYIKANSILLGNDDASALVFSDVELFEADYNFREMKVDENGIVLWGIREDGSVYQPKGLPEEVKTQVLSKVFSSLDLSESDDYLFETVTLDANGYILFGIRTDGSFYQPKGIPSEVKEYIKTNSSSGGILNIGTSITVPLPRQIARLEFTNVPEYYAMSATVPSRVGITYNDFDGNSFTKQADITYQGQFTATLPKKNFTMDMFNEDGSSCKMTFGDWPALDSFQLKADYSDSTHIRNLLSSNIYESIINTRPFGSRNMWEVPFSKTNSTLNQRFFTGAKGCIDGFYVELYMDGAYIGLHNFNLKKHRDNYNMTSSNKKHILLDCGMYNPDAWPTTFTGLPDWEIRNPKYTTTDPPAECVTSINRLFAWINTDGGTTWKTEAPSYLNINRTIDYFIHMQIVDNWDGRGRNFILGTMDNLTWWFHPYDMDNTFGAYSGSGSPIQDADNHINSNQFWVKFRNAFQLEINARYAELMTKNIITTKAVEDMIAKRSKMIPYAAYKKEFDKWPDVYGNTVGFYGSPMQMIAWYRKRIVYMNTYFAYAG
ncbi:CotH kinase family protein [Pedobacter sp. MC2016-24]|uniref:CotH kinase family protein n=1 Tax=Pedobacter sp. MC2016-24 TaxID=2780090 RepID=UPI00187FCBDD|nr:CotH kinase family protein [Pedobacter sp. MC2016-24]MBE9598748.1 CotH kinase family protein [Pedobacter sp. MC2016-24]